MSEMGCVPTETAADRITASWETPSGRKLRRERIATAALQGLLCHPPLQSYEDAVQHPLDAEGAWLSRLALKYADTLIAELDRD